MLAVWTLVSAPGQAADHADRSLVERLARGDGEALGEIYDRHGRRVYSLVLRIVRDQGDAEELVQECWTRAVEGLDRYLGAAPPRSWLGGILLNCWRESRRELRWIADEPAREDAPALAVPARDGARIDLERALAELPDGSRAVVVLFDVCGHSHEEIAERLRIPTGTSKRRLFDARRALRRRLGEPEGGRP